MPSGTKLVAGLGILALALGVGSWWYRFESAHRSTGFWGPTAAELIARPSQVSAMTLVSATEETARGEAELLVVDDKQFVQLNAHEVTDVPGMVHLRNSLLTDSNYDWNLEVKPPRWRYGLLLNNGDQNAHVLFSEDFTVIGLLEHQQLRAVGCQPMAETLREYFASSRLFDASSLAE